MEHWSDKAPFTEELKARIRSGSAKEFWVIVEVGYSRYWPEYQRMVGWLCPTKFSALATEISLARMAGDKNIVKVELDPKRHFR